MRNCLILGSGRSGTSLAAAMLAKSGYFMGRSLSQERESNLITNFEDIEINRLNENLLAQVLPSRLYFLGRSFFHNRPAMWQRWLARIPLGTTIPSSPQAVAQIKELTSYEPYCFKDPRFSYVLPVWKPYLKDTVFVCIFRHPDATAQSILRLCNKANYLKNFSINYQHAMEVWTLMYKHILSYCREGKWFFIHYEQLIQEHGYSKLASFLDASIDVSLIDNSFVYSNINKNIPKSSLKIYTELCELANFQSQ